MICFFLVMNCFRFCFQGQVFTNKEVEKLASKEKGITPMAVEEVLKSLLDDNEVMTDKIGTSNYYWAFASQERVQKQNKVDALARTLATQQTRLTDAQAENEKLLATRPNTVRHYYFFISFCPCLFSYLLLLEQSLFCLNSLKGWSC